jgi:MFS family permease
MRDDRARIAISIIFLLNGLTLSAWVSRVPAIVEKLGMNTGSVGTVMMGMAVGALASFPVAGKLIDSIGSARATTLFGVVYFCALPVLALAPNPYVLLVALILFGFGNGGLDLAMNAQGIEIEARTRRSIINSLHGFFSLGGLVGAVIGAFMAWQHIEPIGHFAMVAVLNLALLTMFQRHMVPDVTSNTSAEPAPFFSLPHRSLWILGIIALCTAVGEGAMNSWSALYLNQHLHTSEDVAALGYAGFSLAMLTGRFNGDRFATAWGSAKLIRRSGSLAAIGLGIATLIDQPWSMLIGFIFVGLGLAVVYPLVFSAAGNHPTLPRGRAVAGTATVGYTGFLAGPPILGWVAQVTSMRSIMVIVVILCAVAAVLAPATAKFSRAKA